MMRKVHSPLDPRFADVEIEDRDDRRPCNNCRRLASRACGHCGSLMCEAHATFDGWNNDYLCSACVQNFMDMLDDDVSPGVGKEWRASLVPAKHAGDKRVLREEGNA